MKKEQKGKKKEQKGKIKCPEHGIVKATWSTLFGIRRELKGECGCVLERGYIPSIEMIVLASSLVGIFVGGKWFVENHTDIAKLAEMAPK